MSQLNNGICSSDKTGPRVRHRLIQNSPMFPSR